ncbi:MAG TPA: metallopeptidase family protein [Kofleriaceae bacterium]|nr:metallopeptidase family protein [Kofleriaceae bacterium]
MPTERFAVLVAAWMIAACNGSDAHPASPALLPTTHADTPQRAVSATKVAQRIAPAHCPPAEKLAPGQSAVEGLVHESASLYQAGRFAPALACADVAVDADPQAVAPHHMRAVALAALGEMAEARTAFAVALALAPDDPQILAAASDFYINVWPDPGRDELFLGLAYARDGADRAATTRRSDRDLRARLWLLQAQAENDLGRADVALPLAERALTLRAHNPAALHERGIALFALCRLDEAKKSFEQAIAAAGESADPYTYYHLALIAERAGDAARAATLFARARTVSKGRIAAPALLSPADFRAVVDSAIARLPEADRALLSRVKLAIADLPALADLTASDPPFPPTILGLFRGSPVGPATAGTAPIHGAIVLYRKNLARAAASRGELLTQIERTLRHEIGHVRGLSEADLRRLGLD